MSEQQQDGEQRAAPDDADRRLADLELDDVDVKDLLRKALDAPSDPPQADILTGVQRKIRAESDGKFFADGWSTASAPRATFLVTSLIMLIVALVAWALLGPVDLRVLP